MIFVIDFEVFLLFIKMFIIVDKRSKVLF